MNPTVSRCAACYPRQKKEKRKKKKEKRNILVVHCDAHAIITKS